MIKTKRDFWLPLPARIVLFIFLLSILLSFMSRASSVGSYSVQTVLFVLCLAGVMARDFLEVNIIEKTYREYTEVWGWKFGVPIKFGAIEKLFINKINLSSEINKYGPLIAPNLTARSTVYKCFLKFDDGEKILLDKDSDKEDLITRLKKYNAVLKTTLYDTTTTEMVIIE